ncbi:MAG: hypothetical protein KA004_19000 [Verrucomicrobiales bacterium]|nr:hypothetical protein [Verrucomicrobiales bacterium]
MTSIHAIIPGDFVFGDLLDRIAEKHGCPERIDITTLSISERNVQTLLKLANHASAPELTLLLSYYFRSTNKDIFRAVETLLVPKANCRVAIGRVHTKVILLDYPGRPLVIESSANLRSSNCIEQVTILCSEALLKFHRAWIDEFQALAADGNHESMVSFTQ